MEYASIQYLKSIRLNTAIKLGKIYLLVEGRALLDLFADNKPTIFHCLFIRQPQGIGLGAVNSPNLFDYVTLNSVRYSSH